MCTLDANPVHSWGLGMKGAHTLQKQMMDSRNVVYSCSLHRPGLERHRAGQPGHQRTNKLSFIS